MEEDLTFSYFIFLMLFVGFVLTWLNFFPPFDDL